MKVLVKLTDKKFAQTKDVYVTSIDYELDGSVAGFTTGDKDEALAFYTRRDKSVLGHLAVAVVTYDYTFAEWCYWALEIVPL
jgi:hypothetical protein